MGKVVNLQDKIQSINDKKNELDTKRKKALNKKTTFHFNYYELFVLIMELSDNLLYYDDLTKDLIENDELNDSIQLYSYNALHISRLVKKLYKLYLDNNCFSDSKIQLTLSDLEICMEALETTCDGFVNVEREKDGTFTFTDEYKELDKYHKTAFYLYTIIKNERKLILEKAELLWKQSLNKKELKKHEEAEKIRESFIFNKRITAKNMVYDLYKNHYLNEYRSKIQFIYESTTYIGDHALWSSYFVKGNTKFNKFMAKYHYHRESKDFIYYYERDIEDQKEMGSNINYFPIGWRFHADIPKEEEYEEAYESDDYEYFMEYEDFILLKLKEEIKNSEEMQDFKFDIIDYEEIQDIYNDFDILNENLLDKFEIVIETYCGANNIIYPDGKIGDEFDKIILLSY